MPRSISTPELSGTLLLSPFFTSFKKVFTKEVNQVTKREQWTLQPSLTYKKLDAIIKETRKLIIELYTQCEKDFRQGIKLFETVVEKKEQIRNENRREHLEEEFNKLLK